MTNISALRRRKSDRCWPSATGSPGWIPCGSDPTANHFGSTEEKIHEDITCDDICRSEENLWNFLFFTGHLKMVSVRMEYVNRYITMAIPNLELLYIYESTVETWFQDELRLQDLSGMYRGMLEGDAEAFLYSLGFYKKQVRVKAGRRHFPL